MGGKGRVTICGSRIFRISLTSTALAVLSPITATDDPAVAQNFRRDRNGEYQFVFRERSESAPRLAPQLKAPHPEPLLALISLNQQRLRIFDRTGVVATSAVSTGRKGYETPEGVFSIIERKEDHFSNLYEDGYMPYMQRITWSGVALHGGQVPGYPASHGCIRLPDGFAEEFFNAARINTRVVITPHETAPAPIKHPLLPQPRYPTLTPSGDAQSGTTDGGPQSRPPISALEAARRQEAAASERSAKATKAANDAKAQVKPVATEVTKLQAAVRQAELAQRRAEAGLAAAERAKTSARSAQAIEQARSGAERALAAVESANKAIASARDALAAKTAELDRINALVKDTEEARNKALVEARDAWRLSRPISVLISRKEQRIYVRQAFNAVLDLPVTVRDADEPIGTHLFTVLAAKGDGTEVDWSFVTVEPASGNPPPEPKGQQSSSRRKGAQPPSPQPAPLRDDLPLATAALDRITIPDAVLDRVAPYLHPGSMILVSDHAPSIETGQGTDFVIQTRGEEAAAASIAKFVENKKLEAEAERLAQEAEERSIRRQYGSGRRQWQW